MKYLHIFSLLIVPEPLNCEDPLEAATNRVDGLLYLRDLLKGGKIDRGP